ncbi:hypothetical protein [Paenibacillus agilis]|uniref:Uncharacterized protein n=1 Tax=Paenibacillus agilis TaxID=3020863 RepID=A0A559IQ99_9BACL|nr:hypothetical protein [Paenibacillus agilis]TVX89815.1 hypothetical protein FPZ44_18895 [Paenibacillus agilis]
MKHLALGRTNNCLKRKQFIEISRNIIQVSRIDNKGCKKSSPAAREDKLYCDVGQRVELSNLFVLVGNI